MQGTKGTGKMRDVWAAMHARNEALGLLKPGVTCKPVAATVAKAAPPDPCDDCHNLKGNLCGGVKLPPHAEREGCIIKYW